MSSLQPRCPVRASLRSGAACALFLLIGCDSNTEPSRRTPRDRAGEPCSAATPLPEGVPGSPGNLIESDINPNGQSELAWWMRRFTEDLRRARQRVLNQRPVRLEAQHERIRCSWPTAPEDRKPPFDALAVAYLERVDAFNRASAPTVGDFNAVVDGCANCHDGTCSGPLRVIEGLHIQDSPQ